MPSLAPFAHQTRLAKQAQMSRDRWTRDGKRGGNPPRRLTTLRSQQIEHGTAGWVGQGREYNLRTIPNRSVPHNA